MDYLDNASTTAVDQRVLQVMSEYHTIHFGNPTASNEHAKMPLEAVNRAKGQVAKLINAKPDNIIFNSGSTEGINHVIKSLFFSSIGEGKNHLIISSVEHKAVIETANYLEKIGCKVTKIAVDKNCIVDLKQLETAITEQTFLVCVMLVNNETGVIQPLENVVSISKKHNVPVFTDATQAVGKIEIDVDTLEVDYLCLSAHKLKGPKGVGALYLRSKQGLEPLLHGGNQAKELRGGTQNVPGIVGLGKACEIGQSEMLQNKEVTISKKDQILKEIIGDQGIENFGSVPKVENIISISLKNESNDDFLNRNHNRFSASTGSACNAELIEDSHVLQSIPDIDPKKVIRISI